MTEIINPIDPALLKAELTPERKLRDTNKAGNEIYILNGNECPNVMLEIGRIREEAFRNDGGGTGKEADIDQFDTMDPPCMQLVVWDPQAEAILGGYRYILGENIRLDENGQPIIASAHLFKFSDKFIKEYLPYTIELGRSFVAPEYQSSKAGSKALFALDNLWDGIASLMVIKPEMKYFFGKMTMYPSFDKMGRDMILCFLKKYFADKDALMVPHSPLMLDHDEKSIMSQFKGEDFKEDYKILNSCVRELGYNIPPLVNSYMKLSPTMKVFGTAVNDDFGDVHETGILIDFDELYDEKISRHVGSFAKWKLSMMRKRFPRLAWLQTDVTEEILTQKISKLRLAIQEKRKKKEARRGRKADAAAAKKKPATKRKRVATTPKKSKRKTITKVLDVR